MLLMVLLVGIVQIVRTLTVLHSAGLLQLQGNL